MKNKSDITLKKKRQEHITNLMLVNTVEAMLVLVVLTLMFKWMNSGDMILFAYNLIPVMLVVCALATGLLLFLYYQKKGPKSQQLMPHILFTAFLTVKWAVLFYGTHSPYGRYSFIAACALSLVYIAAAYYYILRVYKAPV